MRILVVEDDADAREIVVEILQSAGHEVDGTCDGIDAINMALAQPYDVVFSDIGLFGCDGWTVARMIGRRCPQTRIYLLTGWKSQIDRQAMVPEVLGVYRKPYSMDLLIDLVAGRQPRSEM